MRTLIVKTTSMGDVLHALPALTDARSIVPDVTFDWVVEQSFEEIPGWHPAVDTVVTVAMRGWRHQPGKWFGAEVRQKLRTLRRRNYDHVIDAQGLFKSALIARLARGGQYHGFSYGSARESLSSLAYSERVSVSRKLHAVQRIRLLFAGVFGYDCPTSEPDYGIDVKRFGTPTEPFDPYLVFIHAATWQTKLWPEPYWHELIRLSEQHGFKVRLPWGNQSEHAQAQRLSSGHDNALPTPKLELGELASLLTGASGVVSVDTGPGHLAAALATPCVSIYGSTDAALTGTKGHHQYHEQANFECAPCLQKQCTYSGATSVQPACYATVSPHRVWGKLHPVLRNNELNRD